MDTDTTGIEPTIGAPRFTVAIARASTTLGESSVPLGDRPDVAAHMSYVAELERQGLLAASGPFHQLDAVLDTGEPVGLLVLRCDVDAARRITADDPAVSGGDFDVDLLPWFTGAADAIQ